MKLTVEQCRAGRALLGWSIADLATAAAVGVMTLNRFEAGQAVRPSSVNRIADALTSAGLLLIDGGEASAGGGPGVRLA